MVKYPARTLNKTFAALADPTRRLILAHLARGDRRVTDLARPHDMSLPAVSKHFTAEDSPKEKDNTMKTTELELNREVMSAKEWEAARQQLLVKEKQLTRARDALAAERRRMPWLAVEKEHEFDGPKGNASLLDLFDGRRPLIVYRAFFEPGVVGWPEHACVGCS